jgi:cytochrome bd ubiquinol oxidase subunit I
MELFDALTLARLQFAFTVSFHIVLPAFTIGLASYLAVLEGLWLVTGRGAFLSVFNYWKKIFALSFGMGVISIVAINSAIIAGRRRPAMRSTLRASSLPPTGGR